MSLFDKIRSLFRFKLWAPLRINSYPSYNSSHSQFGEDMFLRSMFTKQKKGFYVDIGAHHPVYYSNTYHFYKKGWRGLNIDAAPGSMNLFKLLRSEDINLETCIGPKSNEEIDFFVFDQPALNTFDAEMAKKAEETGAKKLFTRKMKTQTLEDCLASVISNGQKIDFLSIDVEGMDETILRSNNWKKFSPTFIVFESHNLNIENVQQNGLVKYLNEVGYCVVGKMGPSFVAQLR